ncbi:MAG: Lipopolysaccharide export system protein LptA [Bryobacteraceae bacterium]|nr:Lipopolysaccharide export system protein LptA [Bryobacteraceae bacterium]
MRRARPLFLLAILVISGYLAVTYRHQLAELRRNAPPTPKPLDQGVNATATDWHWEKSSGNGPAVSVRAKNFRQIKEPSRFELEKVDLKIYRADGKSYDHVLSERAIFDMAEAFLYSEGEADITMGEEEGKPPSPARLVHIKSSGIRFDSKTGKAETSREATFLFERGEGKAVGAVYDPLTRELLLRSKAQLIWHDRGPVNPRPMKVEADQILYLENESKVVLSPWAKLTRGNMTLEGKGALVTLDKNGIRQVDTTAAKGSDRFPGRVLDYAADQLTMSFNEKSEVEKIRGTGGATLTATTAFAVTSTHSSQIDLDFNATGNESILRRAAATGQAVVESKPIARTDRPPAETRILRSETVEMTMRPDGREIDAIHTPTPGVLEFLPNLPGQRRRRVDGDRFDIVYGAANTIESFHTNNARTRTESGPGKGRPRAPALTSSRELQAYFAPKTGEMTRLEQSGDFRYEEAERKARSERALLDQTSNRITLIQDARVWDASGATSADQIVLDQKSEDFTAEGHVNSSRLPDRKGSGSAMLSGDEPTQARAMRMTTRDQQSLVIYDGNAVLWQGANRLRADHIEIERKNGLLRAHGHVASQLIDRPDEAQAAKPKNAAPVFTLITAPSMTYSDKDRVAHYTGGVFLRRAGLDVRSRELRAYLKDESKRKGGKESGSSVEKAAADGGVVIVQTAPDRTRRGVSEHADYYVDEQKIILEQGSPELRDSLRGVTKGKQLTYFAGDDRLLVNGVTAQPAVSRIRRK